MSRKSKTLLLWAVSVAIAAFAISTLLIARASPEVSAPRVQDSAPPRIGNGPRNLFLQPEALRVSRRLGKRFAPSSRAVATSLGNLTLNGSQQPLTLVRRQTESGERVELLLGSRALTWSEREGPGAVSGLLNETERLLVERLTLDSPDQFVLAQLRGASYFTVARNVRPAEAVDGYTGPLWNLVRVDEPRMNEHSRPLSTWRIYYLNVQTGLPDRIEYQLNGQQEVRVDFVEWTEGQGEKTPSHITWSSNGQTVMEYRVTNVSHNQ